MNPCKTLILACALSIVGSADVSAQDRGTREEATAMVDSAVGHVEKVGPQQAWRDFSNSPRWKKKDLYVIAFDMQGTMLAHGANPQLIGMNHLALRDASGKAMTAEMIHRVATAGSGWVDYAWSHPITRRIESKSTYVRKLTNFDGLVGVGVYR